LVQGDFINQYIGVHSAGHYSIGGDAGTDFFNSPSDPYFYCTYLLLHYRD
jgi:tyrosinase